MSATTGAIIVGLLLGAVSVWAIHRHHEREDARIAALNAKRRADWRAQCEAAGRILPSPPHLTRWL